MYSAANGDASRTAVDQRRLQRALTHVTTLWFPVNPEVLAKVKSGLAEGRYDLGMEFLVEDLKTDLALYTFCLRELTKMLHQDGVTFNLSDPIEFFELAGLARVRVALAIEAQAISRHSQEGMTNLQARQVEASLVSAAAAQMLADGSEVAPDCAYLTAALRQLGLTLISWNYPSVYQKAVESQTSERDLDATLSERLGFSPLLLAVSVAKEWGLAPEVSIALSGNIEQTKEQTAGTESAEFLSKLCQIGEALARANQPEVYPTASADWAAAKTDLQNALGPDALKLIEKQVREYCVGYSKSHPELFAHAQDLNPEHNIHLYSERSLIGANEHLENCSPLLRVKFKEFYTQHSRLKSIRDSLQLLVKNVFPLMEFSGGLVYTLDSATSLLTPRLKIGSIGLQELKSIQISQSHSNSETIMTAFHSSTPVTGNDSIRGMSYLAAKLGGESTGTIGVLYVEVPTEALNRADSSHILNFRALRKAFEDLLGLK